MNKEIWYWIPGFKGSHKISTCDRIKSINRYSRHCSGSLSLRKGRLLKGYRSKEGYLFFNISLNGNKKQATLGHLKLMTFIGPCPSGRECCHRDDNPKNDDLSNLYWGTHSQNMKDTVRNGNFGAAYGEDSGRSKLTNNEVKQIRRIWKGNRKVYGIQTKLSIKFGVSVNQINLIIRNKSRTLI